MSSAKSITLRDGREAQLLTFSGDDPPPYEMRAQIREFVLMPEAAWVSYGEQVHLARSLAGQHADQSRDYYYIALVDDDIVATTWVGTGREHPEIGDFGAVITAPRLRGQGLSSILGAQACADFDEAGGKVLYLGTGNPVARRVYRRVGFATYNGGVMRRLSPGISAQEVDEWLFGQADEKQVRPAHWGDLARATALYTQPHPWLIKDYREGIYSHPSLPLGRCNSIFIALLLRAEAEGASLLVLASSVGGIVGTASVTPLDRQAQAGTAELEILLAPEHVSEGPFLLESVRRAACEANLTRLMAWVADCDHERLRLLEGAEFTRQATLPEQLAVGDESIDLHLLVCGLAPSLV